MRQGRFTLDNLMKYVIQNQIEVIPAKYYNDDAQVKYLDFGSLYTYCCHGNKELLVKRWLRERIAYVDSMMGYFTSQDDQVTIRMNRTGYVEFSVTPYIPLYFSVKWSNADGGTQTFKLKRGETKTFYYTSTTATDQEVIIYHAQYIKELGGLSNLRPSSCILANAYKLNNVEIHSDKLYNVNVSNNKYLRRLNLSGCSTLGTVTATGSVLDVSNCKYLSYLNINDTALTGVLLNTSGGSLKEIYYPKTIQEVKLIKQTLLEKVGLPYGSKGENIPTSLYTVNIQECPNIKILNTSSNNNINKTWISMKYCQNLTIRNALDFETITLDGFQRLKVLRLENMFKLKSLGFDDMLPVGEASTLQYMGISYCPELIDITMNCTSNDYEITFAKGALLNLSGATKLNSISSNCIIHGLETIVLPLTVKHLYFTSEYGTGYSSIKNIWSSRCCEINEEGVLPVAIRYEDQDYIGMDLQGMKLNDIDLGALVNIPRAINFDLSPTTVNPNFNINRDGVEYPYLQPEGVLNLSNYTESLARFFNGVDLDKLEVVVENPLPQTDLSYCFYNSSFSNENLLSPILSNVSNINNLDYCFYKTTIKSPNIVNNISFENGTMNYTFGECNNIKSLSGFTVSDKVTSSIGLFTKCPITSITNTSIKTNGSCSAIFKGCTSLTNASGLAMPNTSDISSAFEECTKLTGMPFIEITDKITDISKLYYGCINIDNIDGMVFGSSISNSEDWINKEQILSANNVVIRNDAMSFEGWNNLRTCNNLLITSNVKTFENYFKDCINLTSITFNELSDFSNLVNMAYAFNNCSKLSSIPINVPDKVTNISYLFSGCSSLTDISGMVFGSGITNATSWIPPNLTTANNLTVKCSHPLFKGNTTLISIDNFTISSNITDISSWFEGCTNLSEDFYIPSHVVDCSNAFKDCINMTHIHSNWENEYENEITSTDCYAGCTGITHCDEIDLGVNEYIKGLDEVPLAWGGYEFTKAHTGIYKIKLDSDGMEWYGNMGELSLLGNKIVDWGDGTVTTGVVSHTYEKAGTYVIKGNIIGNYKNPNWGAPGQVVTHIYQLPNGITYDLAEAGNSNLLKLEYANVTGLKFKRAGGFFANCTKLTKIDGLNTLDMSECTTMKYMFSGCSNLTSLDLSGWNVSRVTNMSDMFSGCKKWTDFSFMKSWDLSSVTSFNTVFANSGISEFSGCVANNITGYINGNFQRCSNLTKVSYEGMNLINVIGNFYIGFTSCSSLKEVSFKNTNLQFTSVFAMFEQCDLLETIDFTSCHFNYNSDSVAYDLKLTNSVKNIIFSENSFEGSPTVIINSTSLTVDSLLSLFNALVTISDSRTLKIGSANLVKLSPEQIKIATDKGWTVV